MGQVKADRISADSIYHQRFRSLPGNYRMA